MGFGDARMAPGASRGCSGERSSALSTQHRPQMNANPPKKTKFPSPPECQRVLVPIQAVHALVGGQKMSPSATCQRFVEQELVVPLQ